MKKGGSAMLKQIMGLLSSIAKAKSMAIKSKTSAFKVRLIMFSLMKNKKLLLGSISNKIHGLLGQHDKEENGHKQDDADASKDIIVHNAMATEEEEEEDDKYPDLTHSLFNEDDEMDLDDEQQGGSIIDLVRNSKEEGEDFRLEDEIDHVADLFITRFYKQMRLQKLLSFKRHQEQEAFGGKT
ncbi:uncharacterized protein LOC110818220 [Carica papaya]|uniref:uncharacterized protein LOC110818220 n=1 Tax=Carica papaya TaxID=3649 RepID=UPI000B8D0DE5|nr:uncharacterized protein LOC110818220 [Carica papaya]